MNFPLYSMDGHKLTSLKGEVSSFYELLREDIEQMDSDTLEGYLSSLKLDLSSLKSSSFFKVYNINGSAFVNTDSEIDNISDLQFIPCVSPLEVLFENGIHSTIDFYDDYFVCNGSYNKILSVKSFSSELEISELQDLADSVLSFRRIDNVEAKSKLNLKRKLHFGQLFENIKNIDSENAYQEAEDLLEDISHQEDSLFIVELFFLLKDSSKESVDKKAKDLINELKSKDCEVLIESRALATVFNSLVPGVRPLFLRDHLCPASYLVHLFPLKKDLLQDSGIKLFSKRGKEIGFNLFDSHAHNYNCLITGSSGQGKSVLANKILLEEFENGTNGVVLDLGNSFKKTAQYLDGTIFSEKFNPFSFKDSIYLKEFILSFIDKPWDQREQGRLVKAINEKKCFANNFRELVLALSEDFTGIDLYFEEVWQYFSDSNVSLSNLIYCDLTLYPDRLKRPLIIFLIECFKKQTGKRIFIFDECWNLLENNARYIAECFRTFRKHNASAIAISQNIDDFSETELGKVIIQNTFYKILFRQTVSNNVFLSPYEKELIQELRSQKRKYSEFIVISEDIRKIARFYPSAIEYELFTSDKSDMESFDRYFKEVGQYFGFHRAIENYVSAKYLGEEL